jgi:hypothetical protein
MPDWARKNMDELNDCVHKEILVTSPTKLVMVELNSVAHQIQLSRSEPARNLASCREAVCILCRQNKLYQCDFDDGWSSSCAFVRHHVNLS